jgi:hypothetical protein
VICPHGWTSFHLLVLLTITLVVAMCVPQNSHILSIRKSDSDFTVYTVVDDTSSVPGWVTLENSAGRRFPVPEMLADAVVVN